MNKEAIQEMLGKLKDVAPAMLEEKDLPLYFELQAINESLKKIADKETPQMEMPETHKVQIEGVEVVTLKGEKGDTPQVGIDFEQPKDGKDYVLTEKDKKEIASKIIVPVVEKIIEKTEVVHEQPIVTNEVKEVAISETAEQIVKKLESLKDEERLDASAIKNLQEKIDELNVKISNIPRGGGGGGRNATKFYPLTADGTTKIFSVPKSVASIVLCSDFPTVLMENNGFTINNTRTQITITTDNAPSSGAQLLYQYTSMFG